MENNIENLLSDLKRIVNDYEDYPEVMISSLKIIINKYDKRFDDLITLVDLQEDVL